MTAWQGKKWHGISVYSVTRRLDESAKLAQTRMTITRVLEQQIRQEQKEAAEALVGILGEAAFAMDLKPENVRFGYWDCEESPTKHCVYDHAEDPRYDACIFCAEPAERGS